MLLGTLGASLLQQVKAQLEQDRIFNSTSSFN